MDAGCASIALECSEPVLLLFAPKRRTLCRGTDPGAALFARKSGCSKERSGEDDSWSEVVGKRPSDAVLGEAADRGRERGGSEVATRRGESDLAPLLAETPPLSLVCSARQEIDRLSLRTGTGGTGSCSRGRCGVVKLLWLFCLWSRVVAMVRPVIPT